MDYNRQPEDRTESLMFDLYNAEEIGSSFLKRKFTENEINTLRSGGTIHWKNMDLGGQEKRDINLKMQRFINDQGQVEKGISVQVKAPKLEIPDKILDKKLNPEEKENLKNGNFFCLERNNNHFMVKIDQKINSVIVRTPSEIGIKEELGGYRFSNDELNRLANQHEVGPKVYHSEKHGYFISNLKISQQGNSNEYKYSNIINITKKEAEKLIPILNRQKGLLNDNDLNKILDVMGADGKELVGTLKKSIHNGQATDKKESSSVKTKNPGEVKSKSVSPTTIKPSLEPKKVR